MKNLIIRSLLILFTVNLSYSQEWMTNLDIAQKLALVQNKMILMVWQETTLYPYPVLVKDDKGRTLLIENLFEDETVTPLIWKNFIPVIVNEDAYADLYLKIKGKRKQNYIDKFNDDSIKIMDVNGNIINASDFSENYENISKLIENYSMNTEFIALELANYKSEKTFYSAYYLAAKYLDFALYANKTTRQKLVDLSNIYVDEAIALSDVDKTEGKLILKERVELLKIQQHLILKRPKKVLRQLKRMNAESIQNRNKSYVAFLYYITHSILKDEKNAEIWKAEVSSVNLKKAELIINLNS